MAWNEDEIVEPEKVGAFLKEHQDVGYVSFIHHETTSGTLNPLKSICDVIKKEIPDA
jgi:aspartate aminotransferase-like enzyme